MLLETEARSVTSSGVMQVARATIKATPKVFNFFADMTYSNKPVAICRELVANAVDAHTAAGTPDVPVEVWLANELDPVFRVRDHGIGMSHEFMMTRFMAYTDGSTKDGSNLMIGGFGIGSKSPFAYVDQYTIRSAHDGVVSVYSVFKDEEGIPSIGLLAQGETTEANGVEVSFPVERDDFATFEAAAFESLRYFTPLPVIHNAVAGAFNPPEYQSQGSGWGMRDKAGPLNIIMGGVCYPVKTSNLPYELRYDNRLSPLLEYGLDLTLPVGSCGVALSREALSYDEKTGNAIQQALEDLIDEIVASFSTMFDNYQNWWDARKALSREVGDGYRYSGRAKLLTDNAFYRGQPLTVDFTPAGGSYAASWTILDRERLSKRQKKGYALKAGTVKWEYHGLKITPGRTEVLIIDDLEVSPKSKTIARIKNYVEEDCDRDHEIVVIRPTDHTNIQPLLDALGNPPSSAYVLTSSLDVPVVERVSRKMGARPRVRLFTHGGYNLGTGYRETTRVNPNVYDNYAREIPYADQPETGILVTLTNFEVPAEFFQKMAAGLIDYDELHFANVSDAAKLKGWQNFDNVFADRLKEALGEYPELPASLALRNNTELKRVFSFIRSYRNLLELTPRQQKLPFGKIVALYDRYIAPVTNEQIKLTPYVTAVLPARIDPAALNLAFAQKQWKADRLVDLIKSSTDIALFLENM
jgi:hypothetical protein